MKKKVVYIIATSVIIFSFILFYWRLPDTKKEVEAGVLSFTHTTLYKTVEDRNLSLDSLLRLVWKVLESPDSIVSRSAASVLVDMGAGDLLHPSCFNMDKYTYNMAMVDFLSEKYKGDTDVFRKQIAAISLREMKNLEANKTANALKIPTKKELESIKQELLHILPFASAEALEKFWCHPCVGDEVDMLIKIGAYDDVPLESQLDSLWKALKEPSFKTSWIASSVLAAMSTSEMTVQPNPIDQQTRDMIMANFFVMKYESEHNLLYKQAAAFSIRNIAEPKASQLADEHGIPTNEELKEMKPEGLRER